MTGPGELAPGEPHPAALDATRYLASLEPAELFRWAEAFASTGLEGNRLGEVAGETLRRLQDGEPVSDRYALGLAFTILYARAVSIPWAEGEDGRAPPDREVDLFLDALLDGLALPEAATDAYGAPTMERAGRHALTVAYPGGTEPAVRFLIRVARVPEGPAETP